MRRATEARSRQRSISAKIRQRIEIYGQKLDGPGTYLQLGSGSEVLLRMELKLDVADQVCSLQQVGDGRFLWIRREMPQLTQLSRVDLRRVRDAIAQSPGGTAVDASTNLLVLGGLPKLLEGIGENFEFQTPYDAALRDVPVRVVRGQLSAERLRALFPQFATAIAEGKSPGEILPETMPEAVVLVFGRDNLFPYRIEFLRLAPRPEQRPRTLVSMELYEVQLNAELDPLLFSYSPGDQEVIDHTDFYLKQMGLVEAGGERPPRQADRPGNSKPNR